MKVIAIIQARMGSTRLPGKIMKNVLEKPLLEYQIKRVKQCKLVDQIVIATTTNSTEQPIIDLCESLNIDYFRGSEDDVLSRYYYAALSYNADVIVRITSDCPLIDPRVIDFVIGEYLRNSNFDYVSNTMKRSYPRGMDAGVLSFELLKTVHHSANELTDREHVTSYIYKRPEIFKLLNVKDRVDNSHYRLTVDTEEDFQLISNIIKNLYPKDNNFSLNSIIDYLKCNPKISLINKHIEQKKI